MADFGAHDIQHIHNHSHVCQQLDDESKEAIDLQMPTNCGLTAIVESPAALLSLRTYSIVALQFALFDGTLSTQVVSPSTQLRHGDAHGLLGLCGLCLHLGLWA